MATDHKETVRQINEAFSRNDLESVLERCQPSIRWNMVGEKLLNGTDEVRQFMGAHPGPAPVITVDNLLSDGDWASCDGTMEMADKEGAAPQHYGFSDLYRFDGKGRIAEIRSYIVKLKDGQ